MENIKFNVNQGDKIYMFDPFKYKFYYDKAVTVSGDDSISVLDDNTGKETKINLNEVLHVSYDIFKWHTYIIGTNEETVKLAAKFYLDGLLIEYKKYLRRFQTYCDKAYEISMSNALYCGEKSVHNDDEFITLYNRYSLSKGIDRLIIKVFYKLDGNKRVLDVEKTMGTLLSYYNLSEGQIESIKYFINIREEDIKRNKNLIPSYMEYDYLSWKHTVAYHTENLFQILRDESISEIEIKEMLSMG